MTFNEKLFLASLARDLIVRLDFCEDLEFAHFIVRCVANADKTSLEPEKLRMK